MPNQDGGKEWDCPECGVDVMFEKHTPTCGFLAKALGKHIEGQLFTKDVNTGQTYGPFTIKDSGKREEYAGGMVRDTTEGKINWALTADGPMLKRWALHLTNGAKKYAKRNWMKAQGQEEYDRAKESAFRHFMQWYNDERDEDHASAVYFNINECEYIRGKSDAK